MGEHDRGEPLAWVQVPDLGSMTDEEIEEWAARAWTSLAPSPRAGEASAPSTDST